MKEEDKRYVVSLGMNTSFLCLLTLGLKLSLHITLVLHK